MDPMETICRSRDLLANPWSAFAVFGLPIIAIIIAGNSSLSNGWRTAVWTVALSVMGTACIANARRCGRVHCYLTGPFFLVMAGIALLYGLGFVPLDRRGWNLIGLIVLVGGIGLCCLPEMFLGKYRKGQADQNHR